MSKKAKKIFLSTGMASINDIRKTYSFLIKNGMNRKNIFILHCTSSYPTKLQEANMLALNHIKTITKNIGFSDHTINFEAAIISVAMGAKLIEKHITLSKKMPGPDHQASMEPNKFIKYVRYIRNAEIALGNKEKKISPTEIENIGIVKKCIVARKKIKKNQILSEKNLTCKRPMIGIPSKEILKILGKKQLKTLKKMRL